MGVVVDLSRLFIFTDGDDDTDDGQPLVVDTSEKKPVVEILYVWPMCVKLWKERPSSWLASAVSVVNNALSVRAAASPFLVCVCVAGCYLEQTTSPFCARQTLNVKETSCEKVALFTCYLASIATADNVNRIFLLARRFDAIARTQQSSLIWYGMVLLL